MSNCSASRAGSDATSSSSSVSVKTLGCKVNLYESEYLSQQLDAVPDASLGNRRLCVVNTCTVTREADRQSRQTIRRVVKRNPDALVVVTGCYAEMQSQACSEIPGVDLVVPGSRKLEIPRIVRDHFSGAEQIIVDPVPEHILPSTAVQSFGTRSRAFVQIQQGCDNGCTFCIIHKARGSSRSILPTTVIRQVEQFVETGYREIVFCGIDLGAYGLDLDGKIALPVLVSEIAARYQDCRFRLSSIDPAHIDDELVAVMREHENVCPHIHLSLQSAAPIILKRMKRRYTPDDVYQKVAHLRAEVSDLILSADVMAGFPTETDADFEMTLKSIDDLEIAYPHVFAYSERDGTPAARIPNQVSPAVRKQRAKILREAGDVVRTKVLNRYIGKQVRVLREDGGIEVERQRTRMNNYVPVYVLQDNANAGSWADVQVTGLHRDGLAGDCLKYH